MVVQIGQRAKLRSGEIATIVGKDENAIIVNLNGEYIVLNAKGNKTDKYKSKHDIVQTFDTEMQYNGITWNRIFECDLKDGDMFYYRDINGNVESADYYADCESELEDFQAMVAVGNLFDNELDCYTYCQVVTMILRNTNPTNSMAHQILQHGITLPVVETADGETIQIYDVNYTEQWLYGRSVKTGKCFKWDFDGKSQFTKSMDIVGIKQPHQIKPINPLKEGETIYYLDTSFQVWGTDYNAESDASLVETGNAFSSYEFALEASEKLKIVSMGA